MTDTTQNCVHHPHTPHTIPLSSELKWCTECDTCWTKVNVIPNGHGKHFSRGWFQAEPRYQAGEASPPLADPVSTPGSGLCWIRLHERCSGSLLWLLCSAQAEKSMILLPAATNILIFDNESGKLGLYVVSIHAVWEELIKYMEITSICAEQQIMNNTPNGVLQAEFKCSCPDKAMKKGCLPQWQVMSYNHLLFLLEMMLLTPQMCCL